MPGGSGPLSDSKIQTIRQWIEEGAARSTQTEDTEPPRFGGVTSAVVVSSTEIDVFWDAAVDDRTAAGNIRYKIFVATESGLHDFLQPVLAISGATTARIGNLEPATRYYVVVRAEDDAGNLDANIFEVSATTLDPEPPAAFRRGDTDNDGSLTSNDAILILSFLFLDGTEPVCFEVADTNGDRSVNLTDAIFLLKHIFLGSEAPAPLSEEDIRACRGEDLDAIERGLVIYNQPDANGNGFSCSTCHATTSDEESELLHVGHSLHDALRRPSFKLGQLTEFVDAANICRVHWMSTTPWVDIEQDYSDVVAFLESFSPSDPVPALVYQITSPVATGPATGDPQIGCELFHRSCVVCHGPGARGSVLAPSLVAFQLGADFIRRKIRRSGPPGTVYGGLDGGRMPFWSRDRLSNEQVEDLAAFLGARPVVECSQE
jgi:thiosulfate dehydrogenase